MNLVETQHIQPGNVPHAKQVYCGLDCCLTFEVLEALQGLQNEESIIYSFERALQAPALELMLRGFLIDEVERQKGVVLIKEKLQRLNNILQIYAHSVWGKPLNPRSHLQLKTFFYDTMNIPEIWTSAKGKRTLSMNRESLEKMEVYWHALPIVACILAFRECAKQLEVLETEVDPDNRLRTSYNIAGTTSGRWSSSQSVERTGGNLQNIAPDLRGMFIADKGMRLYGFDLEQAESREVGWLCGTLFDDWSYYEAAISGDLHTITARLVWPNLPWVGDLREDRATAEQPFYRHFSYRDMSKRGSHGSNYLGTPFTMARFLKVPKQTMETFQLAYFGAYPGIQKWHRWVAQQLQTTQTLTSIFGRQRHFFGRPNDDTTLREAVAYMPQSATADRLNLVLWRVWKHMGTRVQILAQLHDALYLQAPEEMLPQDVIGEVLGHFHIPITHGTRELIVPGEAKCGWNWKNYHPTTNPNGLKKFKGSDPREHTNVA